MVPAAPSTQHVQRAVVQRRPNIFFTIYFCSTSAASVGRTSLHFLRQKYICKSGSFHTSGDIPASLQSANEYCMTAASSVRGLMAHTYTVCMATRLAAEDLPWSRTQSFSRQQSTVAFDQTGTWEHKLTMSKNKVSVTALCKARNKIENVTWLGQVHTIQPWNTNNFKNGLQSTTL